MTVTKTMPITKTMTITKNVRFGLWLIAGIVAVFVGNTTAPAWRTTLSPTGTVERSLVELFGSNVQWAGLLLAVPVMFWATGKRVEAGLAIPLGLFAVGHGIAATAFLFALVGVGIFLDIDIEHDRWQSGSVTAMAFVLVFAIMSPWAGLAGGLALLVLSAVRKSVALPTLIVFFPTVVGSLLVLAYFVDGGPTLIDAIAALGMVCLTVPPLALGVGGVALLLSFDAAHSTAILADSVGVYEVDAPIEITPDLLAEGFVVSSDARFALVQSTSNDEFAVAEADGWVLIDRSAAATDR